MAFDGDRFECLRLRWLIFFRLGHTGREVLLLRALRDFGNLFAVASELVERHGLTVKAGRPSTERQVQTMCEPEGSDLLSASTARYFRSWRVNQELIYLELRLG
jgi:hypothetical protein